MLALILAAAVAAAPAPPQPGQAPSTITQPDWLRRPAAEDMARFYPKAAVETGTEGNATIACRVTEQGLLADCAVTEESPAGQGFGQAALGLSELFKMRPMTRNGAPVGGGKINIPIRFRLPQPTQMPNIALATRCYGFAAAAAERDPSSDELQARAVAWRMALDIFTLREHARPSEFEQLLAALRTSAAGKLDDPSAKTDRDECEKALPPSTQLLSELKAMAPQ